MMVYSLLFISFFFAGLSIYSLVKSFKRPWRQSWSRVLAALALAVVVYLYSPWFFLSVYFKYLYGLVLAIIVVAGLLRKKDLNRSPRKPRVGLNLFFFLLFGGLAVLYFTGTTGKPKRVALAFPLKEGRYFIMQGGKGLPSNLFHYGYRGAVYAIDIAQFNSWGNRASRIFSSRLEDYNIFNDTVYSPCDGRIVRVENDNPDNIPPSRERGPTNTNMIIIETDSFSVFMAHLRQGSVMVSAGETVVQGQPLARVGNSGFTLEPHLHIQAHANSQTGKSWYAEEPLYIEFDGKAYLLFETISPRKVDMVDSTM